MSSIAVICDHRIKNPSKLENGFRGKLNFHLGMFILPTKAPFFYLMGCATNSVKKKEPMICEFSHKFIGSASLRLALLQWLLFDSLH